jgi:hypothetical protein
MGGGGERDNEGFCLCARSFCEQKTILLALILVAKKNTHLNGVQQILMSFSAVHN